MQAQDTALASYIEHTLLRADVTLTDIQNLCAEAIEFGFVAVCVNSCWIPEVSKSLAGTPIKPVAVVGFPLGANLTVAKATEAYEAIKAGAKEIDMVLNIGALKSADFETVLKDIQAVIGSAAGCPVKVIIETALLSDPEKIKACELAQQAGAQFVKTSTGFSAQGATVGDVKLMRQTIGDSMGIKASGGIKNREEAVALIKAGANRLGTSASVSVCKP